MFRGSEFWDSVWAAHKNFAVLPCAVFFNSVHFPKPVASLKIKFLFKLELNLALIIARIVLWGDLLILERNSSLGKNIIMSISTALTGGVGGIGMIGLKIRLCKSEWANNRISPKHCRLFNTICHYLQSPSTHMTHTT